MYLVVIQNTILSTVLFVSRGNAEDYFEYGFFVSRGDTEHYFEYDFVCISC